jgi:chitodextrinase
MTFTSQWQCATWTQRKHSRSKRFIAALTPWAARLVVNAGDFVQSGGMAFRASNSGTTAGAGPNNSGGASFIDGGGVGWVHVAILLTAQPTI